MNDTQLNNELCLPKPPLIRTLSEHHWRAAEEVLGRGDYAWAGTYNGKYKNEWEYWVTKENNVVRRHSFSKALNKEFIVKVC